MKSKEISQKVECWIAEEELPVRAGLRETKPAFAVLFEEDEQLSSEELELENQAYWEFVSWCMSREHQVLLSIPKQEHGTDFGLPVETDDSVSFAFSSADFQRLLPKFNSYQYRLAKIYEKVADLAETYSCLTTEEGKMNIKGRFVRLIDNNFRDDARELLKIYNGYTVWVSRHRILDKIQDLNDNIRKCKEIWRKQAYERDHGHVGA